MLHDLTRKVSTPFVGRDPTVDRLVAGVAGCQYPAFMTRQAVSEIQATVAERDQLAAVQRIVAGATKSVRVSVGADEVELPQSLIRLLAAGADALGDGDSVALVNEESELSPAEAAKLLGVSRQYVDRLVAAGALPARRLPESRYRKIPTRAVLAHRLVKETKRTGIATILDAADEAGLSY